METASRQNGRATLARVLDVRGDSLELSWKGHGANIDAAIPGPLFGILALAQGLGPLNDHLDEAVGDRLLDIDPLDRDADLPGIGESPPDGGVGGALEVGVAQDNHRVVAPQFKAGGNQAGCRPFRDLASRPGAAREGDHVDFVDQCRSHLAVPLDDLHQLGRIAVATQVLLQDLHAALRDERRPFRWLDQYRVPGHQRRDRLPHRQDQRKIPRRDEADDATRLVVDRHPLRHEHVRSDPVRAKKLATPPRVEGQHVADIGKLGLGLHPRLAIFAAEQFNQLFAMGQKGVACRQHHLGAPFVGDRAPHLKSRPGPLGRRRHLGRSRDWNGANPLQCRRTDNLDLATRLTDDCLCHPSSSPIRSPRLRSRHQLIFEDHDILDSNGPARRRVRSNAKLCLGEGVGSDRPQLPRRPGHRHRQADFPGHAAQGQRARHLHLDLVVPPRGSEADLARTKPDQRIAGRLEHLVVHRTRDLRPITLLDLLVEDDDRGRVDLQFESRFVVAVLRQRHLAAERLDAHRMVVGEEAERPRLGDPHLKLALLWNQPVGHRGGSPCLHGAHRSTRQRLPEKQ